jgi:DNA-binding NarL/FixJ family response regulator
VLLGDDHALVLAGLRRLLEPECDVVGTAPDGRALVDIAQRLRPDVIVIDIAMPGMNGFDAARELGRVAPQARLVFLTMYASPALASEAFNVGALGYVLKHSAAAELGQAIRSAWQGRRYVSPRVRRLVRSLASPAPRPLSSRQRQVLRLIAEGRPAKLIADDLGISVRTVEYHKARFAQDLGLRTTAEIVRYAVARGLVSP